MSALSLSRRTSTNTGRNIEQAPVFLSVISALYLTDITLPIKSSGSERRSSSLYKENSATLNMGWIYIITNNVNKKSYIGQTKNDPDKRWKQHLRKESRCTLLKNALIKYGVESFSFCILLETENEYLDESEKETILLHNTLSPHGYNLKEGGSTGKFSDEVRKKMSDDRTGCRHWHFGGTNSEETRERIRGAKTNKPTGRIGDKHPMSKKVDQYSLKGEFIQTFDNSIIAGETVKRSKDAIRFACKKEGRTSGGFIWKFH